MPQDLQEYLDSPQVIRYRFVTVDVELLWNLIESARDSADLGAAGRIQLGLFDNFSVEMKIVNVNYGYRLSDAFLVTTMPGFGTDPESHIFANISLKRGESVTGDIWAAGDIYYILPVAEGPVHVIWQPDPAKLPAID